MSRFKMKRGQESKVSSLAKEDGSLIFSLNGANNSTVRLDQTVNGTVQRLGIAVDKAKSADSASVASTANVAKLISPFGNATANASRNVWFSDSEVRNKPVYNDNFKYNPTTQILTTNISGSAEFANLIKYYQSDSQFYASGDTHIMELGYLKCDGSYQNLTLYITSAFWGNQHGSADFINIQQDTNTNSSATVQSYVHAIRVGGNYDRTFYAYKDQTNKRLYLYVQVTGGNSYGKWNVSVIQCSSGYNAWVSEFGFNKILPTGYEIISKIFLGTANNSNALGGSSLAQVLSAAGGGKFLPLAGGTMTGTITAAIGNQRGIKIGNQWITSASDTNGEVVLQGGHLRFGTTAWDYNQWAGLKYNHSNKGIYLGIADGSQFVANSPQSGGSIYTPGIDNIYVGASTSQKVLTTSNYTSTTDGRYVKKAGDTMTGALNFANGTWNLVGDDAYMGDHNIGGSFGIMGANGNTRLDWCQRGNANKYQGIVYDGTKLATSGTFKADYFEGLVQNAQNATNATNASTANYAKTLEGHPASYFAVASGTSSNVVENGMYLISNTSQVNNRFSVKNGQLTSGNTNFPSNLLLAASSTDYPQLTGDSSGTTKNYSILHFGDSAYRHDIVMACNGANTGIIYAFATTANTGGRLARIMDSLNYSSYMYRFDNQITFSKGLIANSPSSTVLLDGGSYTGGTQSGGSGGGTGTQSLSIRVEGTKLIITTK